MVPEKDKQRQPGVYIQFDKDLFGGTKSEGIEVEQVWEVDVPEKHFVLMRSADDGRFVLVTAKTSDQEQDFLFLKLAMWEYVEGPADHLFLDEDRYDLTESYFTAHAENVINGDRQVWGLWLFENKEAEGAAKHILLQEEKEWYKVFLGVQVERGRDYKIS